MNVLKETNVPPSLFSLLITKVWTRVMELWYWEL